ncbi:MAG: tripartite tricarboxylate transporter substrate-binding protein [Oscillospiraceae bacterium]|nr:tripartite tricarboxylate transporter substrate-binding protein [Oscillospiraceae bacterium]
MKKKKIIIVPLLIIMLAAGIILWFLLSEKNTDMIEEPHNQAVNPAITVPRNAGSTADLTLRAITENAGINAEIRNISVSNGAQGINEVYASPRDGENILFTNLSSVVTSNLTGFTETDAHDWVYWFTAFSPSVVVTRADSKHNSLDDLFSAAELTAANAGRGTMSYIAAQLLESERNITFIHRDYPGINPAINAVLEGEADFLIAPKSDVISLINSGRLKMLHEQNNFGEWYGFMLPKDVAEDILCFYDELWNEAVSGEAFALFAEENGLTARLMSREASAEIAADTAEIIERILRGTGYIAG